MQQTAHKFSGIKRFAKQAMPDGCKKVGTLIQAAISMRVFKQKKASR